MLDFKTEAKRCAHQLLAFNKNHPLINNVLFLKILEREFSDMEQYEVASIINSRIILMESQAKIDSFGI